MSGKVRSSYSVLSPRHSVLLRGIFLLHFPSDRSALALPGTVALRSSDFPHPTPEGAQARPPRPPLPILSYARRASPGASDDA